MDRAQSLLFGEFPRAVGVTTPNWENHELKQYLVHSEVEFDSVLDCVTEQKNVYSSLSVYRPAEVEGTFEGCAVVADKVSFDFDSAAKANPNAEEDWSHPAIPDNAADSMVVDLMRDDESIRDAVLGDICEDVQRLATASKDEGIPIVGVFSGFGIHVHQLYEPTMSRPEDKMASNCRRWTSELTLSTVDDRASGKPFRIMRVPNIERVSHNDDGSVKTGLYTVPLRAAELRSIEPEMLIALSDSPRPSIGLDLPSRPEMKVQEDYLGPGYEEGVGQEKMRPVPDQRANDELAATLVEEITRMPCVYERALGNNPPNDVRVKLGIMFLNAGYSPEETTDIIERLGWVDFDRDTTLYQLRKLKKSGKGDWSCETMAAKGLCVRADDMTDCPTYGYRGGNKPW